MQTQNPYQKKSKFIPLWIYATAFSIVLLVSIVLYLTASNTEFKTFSGEKLTIVLPDGSKVLLNSMSELTFKKSDWFNGERVLKLKGEGYFTVKKGSKFTVITDKGNVGVLGTRFHLKSTETSFEVFCYEGSVKVSSNLETVILGEGNSFIEPLGKPSVQNTFIEKTPIWMN